MSFSNPKHGILSILLPGQLHLYLEVLQKGHRNIPCSAPSTLTYCRKSEVANASIYLPFRAGKLEVYLVEGTGLQRGGRLIKMA